MVVVGTNPIESEKKLITVCIIIISVILLNGTTTNTDSPDITSNLYRVHVRNLPFTNMISYTICRNVYDVSSYVCCTPEDYILHDHRYDSLKLNITFLFRHRPIFTLHST